MERGTNVSAKSEGRHGCAANVRANCEQEVAAVIGARLAILFKWVTLAARKINIEH
jgi:hypothetical protein